jgi:protein PET117
VALTVAASCSAASIETTTSAFSSMSRKAQVTLAVTSLATIAVVWGVHWQQQREREVRSVCLLRLIAHVACAQVMYQGVLRDDERRREKMRQREEEFQISRAKREIYERVQKVRGAPDGDDRDAS